jgi:hypothetical protein
MSALLAGYADMDLYDGLAFALAAELVWILISTWLAVRRS